MYIGLARYSSSLHTGGSTPQTDEQYKSFGVVACIALAADAAITGILETFLTLTAQSRAAEKLAEKNETILKCVEDYKKRIPEGLRKSTRCRQTKRRAPCGGENLLRELQNLAKGRIQ
jgi:hypothetical protein